MNNYFDLPSKLHSFVKDVDYTKFLLPNLTGHILKPVDLHKFVKPEGLEWFAERGLFIRRARLFRASKNCTGGIHIDPVDLYNDYAINIVLAGKGEMQWISDLDIDLDIKKASIPNSTYNVKNFKVIDKWFGTTGLVRVNIPHRIVTKNSVRYCLSLQTLAKESPKPFETAMNLLYS